MKRILLVLVLSLLAGGAIHAQSAYFSSEADAVKYINNMCSRFWLKTLAKDQASYQVTVYINDCDLYFDQKDFFDCKPTQEKPCMPLVLNTLIKVNLDAAVLDGESNQIVFNGGRKDVTTLAYWNTAGWEKKGEFSSTFSVQLDYNAPEVKENFAKLKAAFNFLVSKCHVERTKGTNK